jgi:hypothetical protein
MENTSSDRSNKKENEKESRRKDETDERNEIYPEIKDGFLRVKIPVAEVEGDFRMIPGGTVNEGRECETLVQVLQYGMYQVRTLQCSAVQCSVYEIQRCLNDGTFFSFFPFFLFSFFLLLFLFDSYRIIDS